MIGHLKDEHRLGRNYLAHTSGDAVNAVLTAAGYNFRRLIQWLRLFVAQNPNRLQSTRSQVALKSVLHGRLFRPELNAALTYGDRTKGGRPPFDPLLTFSPEWVLAHDPNPFENNQTNQHRIVRPNELMGSDPSQTFQLGPFSARRHPPSLLHDRLLVHCKTMILTAAPALARW